MPSAVNTRVVGEVLLGELKAHQPVVDPLEARTGEIDHVDLDPLPAQLVPQ